MRMPFAFSLLFCIAAILDGATANAGFSVSSFERGEYTSNLVVRLLFHHHPKSFAVEDETGAMVFHVEEPPTNAAFRAGDTIRFSGIKQSRHNGRLIYYATGVDVLSRGTAPAIPSVTASEITSGRWDSRPVRVSGIVHDVFIDEIDPKWAFIVLICDKKPLYISLRCGSLSKKDSLSNLIGAEIETVGLVGTPTWGTRQQIGRTVDIGGPDALVIRKQPPRSPFEAPPLGNPNDLQPDQIATLGRRLATGRVIALWNGQNVLLRTGDGRLIRAELTEETRPALGDTIDVTGFPETDLYRINLTRCLWRPSGDAIPSGGERETAGIQDVLKLDNGRLHINPGYHGSLLKVRGIVQSASPFDTQNGRLNLIVGHFTVPVAVRTTDGIFASLTPGHEIEATGVCIIETENWRPNSLFPHIKGVLVVTRSADDIRILRRPPWWTTGRLFAVIGGLFAVLALLLIRQRIQRRTAAALARVREDLKVAERTRLAMELHDSLAQNLTGVALEIETADRLSTEDPGAMRSHLNVAANTLKSCRGELRNCLWDLRNLTLEKADMNTAISQTLAPHLSGAELTVRFSVPRDRISDNTAHAILRIVRELTVNAIRHGRATQIRVAGSVDGDRMLFSVRDNGCGFDPETAPGVDRGHFGLLGIRERIDAFEGDFRIDSAPGRGTKATIILNVPKES